MEETKCIENILITINEVTRQQERDENLPKYSFNYYFQIIHFYLKIEILFLFLINHWLF
jgi:hypothetical protein